MFLNFFFDYGVQLIPRKHFLGIFCLIPYIFSMKLIPGKEKIFKTGKWFYDLTFNVISRDAAMGPGLVSMQLHY